MTTDESVNATQTADENVNTDPAQTQETAAPAEETAETKETQETAAETKEEKVIPEKYEFKKDIENLHLSEKDFARIEEKAKAEGLSQEEAQALADGEQQRLTEFVEHRQELLKKQVEKWKEEIAQDPELGGENLTINAENSKRALERFGSDDLKEVLNQSGLGNHPAVFKAFAMIGKAMAEDSIVRAGAHADSTDDKLSRLYPSMK